MTPDPEDKSSKGRGRDETETVTVHFDEDLLEDMEETVENSDEYDSRNDLVVNALEYQEPGDGYEELVELDERITFQMEEDDLDEIDQLVDEGVYDSRSHFFRDALYEHAGEEDPDADYE